MTTTNLTDAVCDILQNELRTSHTQELRALGADWHAQELDPHVVSTVVLEAAAQCNVAAAPIITDVLLGYAAAREESRTRHWEAHLLRRVQQLDGLHRVISAANSTLDVDASLQTVVETVAEVMRVDACSVYLFDQHTRTLCLRATHGLNPRAIGQVIVRLGQGITGWASNIGKPLAVPDVSIEPRYEFEPLLDEHGFRSLLCMPIILFASEKHSIEQLQGVISIQTREVHEYSEEQVAYLEVVAGEIALSVANAQLFQQTDDRLHQKIRELATLQRVTAALASTLEVDALLNLIVEQAVRIARVDRAEVFQQNSAGYSRLMAEYGAQRSAGVNELIDQVIRERRPIAVPNAYTDERWHGIQSLAYRDGFHSLFALPLGSGEHVTGALCFYSYTERHIDYENVQLLSTFADEAAIAIKNARLYEETQRNLKIKSTLLQEIHHRVRNNLQTILALLTMQSRRLEAGSAGRAAFEDSVRRVQAIAAVHNLLSRDDIGGTTVQEIAQLVADNVLMTAPEDIQLCFEITGDVVAVNSRIATLLAILINELVGNAVKHGLSAEGGIIGIDAWEAEGMVWVQVRDDGPKRPPPRPTYSTGLGLQLIETLVKVDLGGSFEFKQESGWTRSVVGFPPDEEEWF